MVNKYFGFIILAILTTFFVININAQTKTGEGVNQTRGDFDGDGKADIGVFRNGEWYILPSSGGNYWRIKFGQGGDTAIPADYDGDGKTDLAVWRYQNIGTQAVFHILRSSDGAYYTQPWGLGGDAADHIVGDYDGDGKADFAVYRRGTTENPQSYFYILQSSDGQLRVTAWGLSGDYPRVGDFDGDGKTDPTIRRDSTFHTLRSSDNGWQSFRWGVLGLDNPLVADFDGDRKSDYTAFRFVTTTGGTDQGTWYSWQSSNQQMTAVKFGSNGSDWQVAADYDGDGKDDYAIYRRYEGTWYILQSRDGLKIVNWGLQNDYPLTMN